MEHGRRGLRSNAGIKIRRFSILMVVVPFTPIFECHSSHNTHVILIVHDAQLWYLHLFR